MTPARTQKKCLRIRSKSKAVTNSPGQNFGAKFFFSRCRGTRGLKSEFQTNQSYDTCDGLYTEWKKLGNAEASIFKRLVGQKGNPETDISQLVI
jgi:hypothetical protein